jgi:F0F1-type ATP synthase membrane subunit b/b'
MSGASVDVQERLDELTVLVEDAKAMPLSASCIVNRSQVLDIIEEIRQLMPESVYRADELLADREAVVQDGRREADRILAQARATADSLVSEHEVYLTAVEEASALRNEVAAQTQQMRVETDDYIDGKLATFEITLQKTLQTVDRGRERLRSQMYQELAPDASQGSDFFDAQTD